MRNKRKLPARGKPKVAVVVDGETEAWYLTMLNRNEPSSKFQIKPEIPQRKSLSEQYEKVDRLSKDYDQVIWIVDMDVILKETREARRGHPRPLEEFLKYMSHLNFISNVTVIINHPCIEIWFLLHFEFTQASFNDCVSAESRLKKYLKDYSKTQKYFTKEGDDIYLKVRKMQPDAIRNSKRMDEFDPDNPSIGLSGMHKLFEILGLG